MASGLGNLRSILLSYRDSTLGTYHSPGAARKRRRGLAGGALGILVALDVGPVVATPLGCGPEGGSAASVRALNADWSLALADGRVIRLAGVDPVDEDLGDPAIARAARERLSGWLAGRTVTVVPLGAEPDRWGRTDASRRCRCSSSPDMTMAALGRNQGVCR